jgi:hypothetical protein
VPDEHTFDFPLPDYDLSSEYDIKNATFQLSFGMGDPCQFGFCPQSTPLKDTKDTDNASHFVSFVALSGDRLSGLPGFRRNFSQTSQLTRLNYAATPRQMPDHRAQRILVTSPTD